MYGEPLPTLARTHAELSMHCFIQWLAHKDRLNEWMDEMIKQHRDDDMMKDRIDGMLWTPCDFITDSLTWYATDDPREWEGLHEEWHDLWHSLQREITTNGVQHETN